IRTENQQKTPHAMLTPGDPGSFDLGTQKARTAQHIGEDMGQLQRWFVASVIQQHGRAFLDIFQLMGLNGGFPSPLRGNLAIKHTQLADKFRGQMPKKSTHSPPTLSLFPSDTWKKP